MMLQNCRTENVASLTNAIIFTTIGITLSGVCAEVITVDDDGDAADFSSIQAAVDYASNGDEILVAPGVYTGTHPAHVVDILGKAIVLRSLDGPEVTFIDGEDVRRGIACFNDETSATVIEGFTITHGYSVPYDYNGDDTIDHWEDGGGGMINFYGSRPTVTDCIFTTNRSGGYGGASFNLGSSSPAFVNCVFENNHALYGGAIHNYDNSSPELDNCTFANNSANFTGGGMFNKFDSNASVSNCTFKNNSVKYAGGGGAMANYQSRAIVINCDFQSNSATVGGGMDNTGSDITATNCTFSDNHANAYGGGMYSTSSEPSLHGCTFNDNTAGADGGGLWTNSFSGPTLTDTVVCENNPNQIVGDWTDDGGNFVSGNCSVNCYAVDFNSDGFVNSLDLAYLLSLWGTDDPRGDANGDGTVDGVDLNLVLTAWGACP